MQMSKESKIYSKLSCNAPVKMQLESLDQCSSLMKIWKCDELLSGFDSYFYSWCYKSKLWCYTTMMQILENISISY